MTYVWIVETDGKKRFVDDRYLSPCRKCGDSVSVCRSTAKCEEKEERADVMCIFCSDAGCDVCEQDKDCSRCGKACHCDADYERDAGK